MTEDIPHWKKYYLKHKDKIHESNKKWRNKNKKKFLEYNREYTKKYLQAHPEKKLQYNRKQAEKRKIKTLNEYINKPLNKKLKHCRLQPGFKYFNIHKEEIKEEMKKTDEMLEKYKGQNLSFQKLMDIILFKKSDEI